MYSRDTLVRRVGNSFTCLLMRSRLPSLSRQAVPIALTPEEDATLATWGRSRTLPLRLEQRQAGVLTQLFYGRQFVTVGRSRPVVLTGRGGCLMEVLVDGRALRDQSIDEVLSVAEVMAMEIYPSTANAPAELIPLTNRGSCGLVAIWTGPRR